MSYSDYDDWDHPYAEINLRIGTILLSPQVHQIHADESGWTNYAYILYYDKEGNPVRTILHEHKDFEQDNDKRRYELIGIELSEGDGCMYTFVERKDLPSDEVRKAREIGNGEYWKITWVAEGGIVCEKCGYAKDSETCLMECDTVKAL